jgi:hypothetical protein
MTNELLQTLYAQDADRLQTLKLKAPHIKVMRELLVEARCEYDSVRTRDSEKKGETGCRRKKGEGTGGGDLVTGDLNEFGNELLFGDVLSQKNAVSQNTTATSGFKLSGAITSNGKAMGDRSSSNTMTMSNANNTMSNANLSNANHVSSPRTFIRMLKIEDREFSIVGKNTRIKADRERAAWMQSDTLRAQIGWYQEQLHCWTKIAIKKANEGRWGGNNAGNNAGGANNNAGNNAGSGGNQSGGNKGNGGNKSGTVPAVPAANPRDGTSGTSGGPAAAVGGASHDAKDGSSAISNGITDSATGSGGSKGTGEHASNCKSDGTGIPAEGADSLNTQQPGGANGGGNGGGNPENAGGNSAAENHGNDGGNPPGGNHARKMVTPPAVIYLFDGLKSIIERGKLVTAAIYFELLNNIYIDEWRAGGGRSEAVAAPGNETQSASRSSKTGSVQTAAVARTHSENSASGSRTGSLGGSTISSGSISATTYNNLGLIELVCHIGLSLPEFLHRGTAEFQEIKSRVSSKKAEKSSTTKTVTKTQNPITKADIFGWFRQNLGVVPVGVRRCVTEIEQVSSRKHGGSTGTFGNGSGSNTGNAGNASNDNGNGVGGSDANGDGGGVAAGDNSGNVGADGVGTGSTSGVADDGGSANTGAAAEGGGENGNNGGGNEKAGIVEGEQEAGGD